MMADLKGKAGIVTGGSRRHSTKAVQRGNSRRFMLCSPFVSKSVHLQTKESKWKWGRNALKKEIFSAIIKMARDHFGNL